jgi:hypothetical protein
MTEMSIEELCKLRKTNDWWRNQDLEFKKDIYYIKVGRIPVTDAIPDMWWRTEPDGQKIRIYNELNK